MVAGCDASTPPGRVFPEALFQIPGLAHVERPVIESKQIHLPRSKMVLVAFFPSRMDRFRMPRQSRSSRPVRCAESQKLARSQQKAARCTKAPARLFSSRRPRRPRFDVRVLVNDGAPTIDAIVVLGAARVRLTGNRLMVLPKVGLTLFGGVGGGRIPTSHGRPESSNFDEYLDGFAAAPTLPPCFGCPCRPAIPFQLRGRAGKPRARRGRRR